MQRSRNHSSGGSVASSTSSTAVAAALQSVRYKVNLLGRKTLQQQSFSNATVSEVAREALEIGHVAIVSSALSDLLFARTLKPGEEQAVYRGAEGIKKLKNENRQVRCGKLFSEGDVAYNCLTCQVDSTCVICQECFDESDHTGHEVTFHRTDPGGCCDCGDEEAWAPEGFCSRHGHHNVGNADVDPRETLPPGVRSQFEAILDAIFADNMRALSEVFKSFAREFDDDTNLVVTDEYDGEDTFNVVLNNDDIHSFEEVHTALRDIARVARLTPPIIGAKTQMINDHGRAPIFSQKFDSDKGMVEALSKVRDVRATLEKHGLLVSIPRGKQLAAEKRAVAGLTWMLEMSQLSQGLARCIVERFVNPPTTDLVDCLYAEAYFLAKCGDDFFWPQHDDTNICSAGPNHLSIVQATLKYDALIPKQFAKHMQGLWLGLLTHVDFKQYLGSSFMGAHRFMASSFSRGLGTREETALILTVQLLTVPSVIQRVDTEFHKCGTDVVVRSLETIKHFLWTCFEEDRDFPTPGGPLNRLAQVDLTNSAGILHERYAHFIVDARYILRLVKNSLVDSGEVSQWQRLHAFMSAIATTQRMNPQRRHQGPTHVDFENAEWMKAFKLSLALQNIIRPSSQQLGFGLAAFLSNDERAKNLTVEDVLRTFTKMAYQYSFHWHPKEVVKRLDSTNDTRELTVQKVHLIPYSATLVDASGSKDVDTIGPVPVSELRFPIAESYDLGLIGQRIPKGSVFQGDVVSHHLPMQRFFAATIRNLGISIERFAHKLGDQVAASETLLHKCLSNFDQVDFDQFAEDVFRVAVANAQIGAQLWRRTGMTMDNILTNYKGVCATSMYQCDVAFLQTLVCILGADRVVNALLHKFELGSFFFLGELPDRVLVDSVNEKMREVLPQIADELLRLIIHICTEIPVAKVAGKAAVRREVIHALAETEMNSTFSKVMDHVRSARIFMSDAQDADGEFNQATNAEAGDIMEESFGVSASEVESMLDNVAVRRRSYQNSSVTFSLKPECWEEVDPLFWNLMRQNEELVAERLCKVNEDARCVCWPMTAPPPGPPISILTSARLLPWCEVLQQRIICQFAVDLLASANFAVARIDQDLKSSKSLLPEARRAASMFKATPGLLYTVLHLLTLAMHTVEEFGVEKARIQERKPMVYDLCLMELVVNLEGFFTQDGKAEKMANMRWCADEMCKRHPEEVFLLRQELQLESRFPVALADTTVKSTGNKVEDPSAVKLPGGSRNPFAAADDMDIQEPFDSAGEGSKGKLKTGDKKKKKKKKNRGAEAQKAAMARIKEAQARALEKLSTDESFKTDDAVHEENYCALCHEHLQKYQYAYLGHVRGTAWGNVLPLSKDDKCPPEILGVSRKAAGWTRPVSKTETHRTSVSNTFSQAQSSDDGDMEWTLSDNAHPVDDIDSDEDLDDLDEDDLEGDIPPFLVDDFLDTTFANAALAATADDDDDDDDDDNEMHDDGDADDNRDGNRNNAADLPVTIATLRAEVGENGLMIDPNDMAQFREAFARAAARGGGTAGGGNATGATAANALPPGFMDNATRVGAMGVGMAGGAQNIAAQINLLVSEMIGQTAQSPSQARRSPVEDPKEVTPSTERSVYVQFCSHAMHMECLRKYISSLEDQRHSLAIPDIRQHEFLCPMCKSVSNVIVPNVSENPVTEPSSSDKRRRVSSSTTPDEMVRFISGDLGGVTSREISSKALKDIKSFADMIHSKTMPLTPSDLLPTLRARLIQPVPEADGPTRVVALWHALAFSLSARAAARRPACGEDSASTSFRQLFELVQGSEKQWLSMLRAAALLFNNENLLKLVDPFEPESQIGGVARNRNDTGHRNLDVRGGAMAAASSLLGSFRGLGASSVARSRLPGFLGSNDTGDLMSFLIPPPEGNATNMATSYPSLPLPTLQPPPPAPSQGSFFERSIIRSPLNRFLGNFSRRFSDRNASQEEAPAQGSAQRSSQGESSSSSSTVSNSSSSTSSPGGTSSSTKGTRSRDASHESTGASEAAEALFEMLTLGSTTRLGKLAAGLAPGKSSKFEAKLDETIAKTVPATLSTGCKVENVDGVHKHSLVPGDKITKVDLAKKTMLVEHVEIPDGVLLNMKDPVILLVALFSALPQSLYIRAVRAVAMATLVQGVLEAPGTEICDVCHTSRRYANAESWVTAMQRIQPNVTADHVYYAIYVKLARFLRTSVLLMAVAAEDTEFSDFMELGDYENDETDELWMRFLGLPSVEEMTSSTELMDIIERWKLALGVGKLSPFAIESPEPCRMVCCLDQTRLRLVNLPTNYEQLLKIVRQGAKCPTTGRPISKPLLCLRCGAIICFNSRRSADQCCSRGGVGPGTLHAMSCGGGSGAFLVVQRCVVVLVHEKHNVRISAPYVDSHGEPDDNLRRGRPLRLHEPAFKNLQFICSNNEICSKVVSTLLKGDVRTRSVPHF